MTELEEKSFREDLAASKLAALVAQKKANLAQAKLEEALYKEKALEGQAGDVEAWLLAADAVAKAESQLKKLEELEALAKQPKPQLLG